MGGAIRTILAVLALAAGACFTVAEAFPGEPLLQRFTPADFKATPYLFSIASDPDGRIYVGNNDGVLRLQGREWETISLPGGMAAGSLARGRDGRVYLSGYDSFGVLTTAPDGRAVYTDLRDAFGLKGSDRELGWMGGIVPVADGVYFRAQNRLLFYSFKGNHRQWPLPEKEGGFSAWHGVLYNLDLNTGLRRFDDGKLIPVEGGAVTKGHRGVDLIDQGDSALVISVGGFYRLKDGHLTALDVPPVPASAGVFQTTLALPDGSFVVGTISGELLEYDSGAHLLSQHKIARAAIGGLDYDNEHGLWAVSEDELFRLPLPSPWSRIDVSDLGGVIGDCEMHDGALWLAVGARGLVKMSVADDGVHWEWVKSEERKQIFNMVSTRDGLLIAQAEGIDVLDEAGNKTQLVQNDQPAYAIVRSAYDRNLAYAPGDEGVYVLRRENGKWKLANLMPAPELATQTVYETAPGVLWINNTRGLPERWSIDPEKGTIVRRERFGLDAPGYRLDPNLSAQIYVFANTVYLAIGHDAFRFDGHAFVPYAGAPFTFMQSPSSFQVLTTPVGVFAYTGSRLYRRSADNAWKREDFGAQPPASQSVLRYGNDGVLRLSVWRALLQYKPDDKPSPPLPPLSVRLIAARRIDVDGRSQSLALSPGSRDVFTQDQGLSLQFAVFSAEPGVEYRYRAPGLTAGFTNWREPPTLGFAGLDQPGDFTIEVQARMPSGRQVQSLFYTFSIAPRWYQITLVRLLAVLVALVGLWVLVRWRERRQARIYTYRQQQLELKIAERTADLEVANRKLGELATADSLTGVANRRALETGLQREWRRCHDQHLPIALLMIDVDHFKQYNDQNGHLAGDIVLKDVARRLVAGYDAQRELLARYGGEEFCLLLPGVSRDIAQRRAEDLRQRLDCADSVVTISIGVSATFPQQAEGAETLLRHADEMLYEAKRRGRNQVAVTD